MKQSLSKPMHNLIVNWDWEKALYVALIVLALLTRLWGLGDRVQSHDESIHTKYSWNLYVGQGFQHHPLMHGPFLFHATGLSYFFFGDNDFSARVPVALMGVAIVAFPCLLRRWLGRAGALATSFFLLISPSIAYYSRYIRHDIPVILWALTVVLAVFAYLQEGRERWLYLMAAGVSLMFATKEVAFIYNAIIGFFLVGLFIVQALDRPWPREHLKIWFVIALVATLLGLSVLGLGLAFRPEGQVVPTWWAIAGGIVAGLALQATIVLLLVGLWRDLHRYRVFDLLIVLGTLCLPFLAALPIKLVGLDPMDYKGGSTLLYAGAIAFAVFLVSVGIGLGWDWRRWSIAAAIHYAIYLIFFTTVLTNGYGIASGVIGSLGYWLKQQGVERGSQPWYYYGITVPLYEYLPLLLTLAASLYLLVHSIVRFVQSRQRPETEENEQEEDSPRGYLIPFLLWWIALSWFGYSYAGEKMPWLTVHLALPMILLSGWLVGRLLEAIDWQQVIRRRAWLLALVIPPLVLALAMLIRAIDVGPFQGYGLAQLQTTGQFVNAVIGILAFGGGAIYLAWRSGWRLTLRMLLLIALLAPVFLTMRTAWRFCYINYDYPTEFLVYAHAAPAVHEAMEQIEELSRRVAGGPRLIDVAYGSDGSTLFYWQLRDYPNSTFYGEQPSREQMESRVIIAGRDQWDAVTPYLGDNYLVNTYTYLWWPMEDYRDLTWARIARGIADPQMRAALWDIWYERDYRRYDEVTGGKHTLDEWPLRSDFRLYVRRDAAGQLWHLSTTGPIESEGPDLADPYAGGWQELAARQVFGETGTEPGQFQGPRGVTIGPEGFVYVADSGNHRIQKFTADGEFVAAWGKQSSVDVESGTPRGFVEPWDVAVAADGAIYVADTWNHRIQKLDSDGELVATWGLFGQFGPGDPAGHGAFYGPRGIAVGADGEIYVTDTGNKRVQVFEPDGEFAFQWGGGGVLEGYLDEPVGVAIGPGGEIYVADTWNQRVQVFDQNGAFLRQWPVAGWDAELAEEKPYLAVDGDGYVYVTDPGYYRVLVFDSQGDYVLSFGQYGFDEQSFALPTGITVAEDGSIYVSDAHGNRILVFDPIDWGARGE